MNLQFTETKRIKDMVFITVVNKYDTRESSCLEAETLRNNLPKFIHGIGIVLVSMPTFDFHQKEYEDTYIIESPRTQMHYINNVVRLWITRSGDVFKTKKVELEESFVLIQLKKEFEGSKQL
jgi:hypothetical protein